MNFVNPKKQLDELHGDISDKKAKGKSKPVWKIAVVRKPLERIWKQFKKTLAGQTLVGRIGRTAKNIFKHILPYGRPIDSVTDFIGSQLKTEDNHMWFIERLQEKTTWRGLVAVATAVGLTFSPELQEAIIATGIALFGLIEVISKEK